MLLLMAETVLQVGLSGKSGANKIDVSVLKWLGAVEVTLDWHDWVRDLGRDQSFQVFGGMHVRMCTQF